MPRTHCATAITISALCLLAGCTDYEADSNRGQRNLAKLTGNPVSVALKIFGTPTRTTAGTKGNMYEWSNAGRYTKEEEARNNLEPAAPYCIIRVYALYDEVIEKVRIGGNMKVCHDYYKELNGYFP